ncbi:MAG: hypothetical protein EBQ94_03005 [Flavobacteriales bacterium]|nr:hypothetical protein [Crocinitomicaceae bacterium]NBX79340.1 hypothetical protein [Flavobacteriales bacterium]
MKTLQFEIQINAAPTLVWKYLWELENYQSWTSVFCPGSYYETSEFKEGNRIRLLTPEGHGMFSVLEKIDVNKFLAFKHLGDIIDFKEKEIANWENAIESYELTEYENGTLLKVFVDTLEKYIPYMEETFPKALLKLKEITEMEN